MRDSAKSDVHWAVCVREDKLLHCFVIREESCGSSSADYGQDGPGPPHRQRSFDPDFGLLIQNLAL